MEKCLSHLEDQLTHFRSTGVTSGLVDTVKVLIDGGTLEVRYVANTSDTREGVVIRPFQPQHAIPIASGLAAAGIRCFISGKAMVCPTPKMLTQEDKKKAELHIKKLGEEAKIAIRMVRQEYRNTLDKDELKEQDKAIQKTTDEFMTLIDEAVKLRINNDRY